MALRIKKYGNRKLFAEGDTKYLSMVELADRVVKDNDVQVVCDRTGRDLTLETVIRALFERAKDYSDEEQFLKAGCDKPAPFSVVEVIKLIARIPARKRV
jgi:polyhydroxyalkanoate synthesis regulator protein